MPKSSWLVENEPLQVFEVGFDRRVRMVVGEGAVDLGVDRVMLAWQAVQQHVEDRPGGAVAGVPADVERLAREALEQPRDIGFANVDLLGGAVAVGPVAGGGALADALDLLPEHGAALQQQFEAVVVGGVVASGDLDAAVDVEIVSREIEHRRGAHADQNRVDPALGQPAHERCLKHARMGAAVPSDGNPPGTLAAGNRGIGPAEGVGIRLGERVADDSADVIFAEDGGVESVGHGLANTPNADFVQGYRHPEFSLTSVPRTPVTLNLFQGPFREFGTRPIRSGC